MCVCVCLRDEAIANSLVVNFLPMLVQLHLHSPTHTYIHYTQTATTLHCTKSNETVCFCSKTGGVTQIQNCLVIRS